MYVTTKKKNLQKLVLVSWIPHVCFQTNSNFHIKWLTYLGLDQALHQIANVWLVLLSEVYVTYVGGICWYMICEHNTTEYFLGDIMVGIITASGEHLNIIITKRTKSDDDAQNVDLPNLCLCA